MTLADPKGGALGIEGKQAATRRISYEECFAPSGISCPRQRVGDGVYLGRSTLGCIFEPVTAVTGGVVWWCRRSYSVGGITHTSASVSTRYRTLVTRLVTWNRRFDVGRMARAGRHQCMARAFLAKGTRLADLAVPVVVSAHVARLDLAICLYCGCGVAVVTGCDVGLI